MTEIQGKSILVRVSVRFELARVRVIGSRLYLYTCMTSLRSQRDYCADGTFLATQPSHKCSRGFSDKNYSTRPLIRSTNG